MKFGDKTGITSGLGLRIQLTCETVSLGELAVKRRFRALQQMTRLQGQGM
jgi:hypothetical protein